jgi:fatty acid desaturase
MSQAANPAIDAAEEAVMDEPIKINWYRSKIDKAVMSELMRKSDAKAFAQTIPQLLLFAATGTSAYLAWLNIHPGNRMWSVPLLLLALFVHGTFSRFFGGIAGHELCHKTPFKTAFWNDFFLAIYSFLSWFDPVSYRTSHVKHHQVTVYADHDGEVVLPQGKKWLTAKFIVESFTIEFLVPFKLLKAWTLAALGDSSKSIFFEEQWMKRILPKRMKRILPKTKAELCREHQRWAQIVLVGHFLLATLFIATGNWILVIIVNFGCQYCRWLAILCTAPQHAGLSPNTPDFRLCCRTFTCNRFIGFLYWNMQYHLEHHMYPAVPFYHLPRLREAIAYDLPPAPHGLLATWKELLPILRRQKKDPAYVHVPVLPGATAMAMAPAA